MHNLKIVEEFYNDLVDIVVYNVIWKGIWKKFKNLIIDDIHEIREVNSKMFESMKSEDICKYIKEKADNFLNNQNKEDLAYA